jgi:hypothetical protein
MEARMQIVTNKKTIVLALTFVLVMAVLQLPLAAARWQRGATVEVAMTDGRFVSGELLAVKGNQLIIHDGAGGRGYSVNMEQVWGIRIKKKSRVMSVLAIGLVTGLGIGVGIAKIAGSSLHDDVFAARMIISAPFLAATIGGLIGANQSRPKTISVKEQTPIQVEWSLHYLENRARWGNKWKDIFLKSE